MVLKKFQYGWSLVFASFLYGALVTHATAQPVESIRLMTFNVWSAEGTQAGRDKLVEIIGHPLGIRPYLNATSSLV